jgi:hypothetical protein
MSPAENIRNMYTTAFSGLLAIFSFFNFHVSDWNQVTIQQNDTIRMTVVQMTDLFTQLKNKRKYDIFKSELVLPLQT